MGLGSGVGGRVRVGVGVRVRAEAHEADVVARRVVSILVAQHHAAQLGGKLHQARRQHDAIAMHRELLPRDDGGR